MGKLLFGKRSKNLFALKGIMLLVTLIFYLTLVGETFGAGQTLIVGMFKEPARLDGRSNSVATHYLPNVVELLLCPDYDLKLQPQLATSWEISKDYKRIVFHLRKGG